MKRVTFTLMMFCMAIFNMQAQDTWTVAGSGAIFGTTWDINDNSNNMTLNSIGNWELVKSGVTLEQGSEYKFKVVKNHSWDEAYPSSDYVLKVEENGIYTVKIQFNDVTHAISVDTEKTGESVIGDKTWTVAGDETLMGSNWKPENSENDMQKQADGTYMLEKKDRTLPVGNYKFKVCANHGWDEAYPGSDYVLEIAEDGVYDVVFTFNPDTKVVGATATKTGGAVVEKTWTVVGDEALVGSNWQPDNTDNDMQKMDDGTYQHVLSGRSLVAATEYKLKVVANHSWDEQYGRDGTSDDYILTVEADGNYDVTVTFNPDTKIVAVTAVLSATGIESINVNLENKKVYDIHGRRIITPKRGLYIVNGKKVIY